MPCCRASTARSRARLDQELYLGKLDYHLNDRNTLSASFNFLHDMSPNGIQTGASSTSGAALTGNGDDAVTVRNGHAVLDLRSHFQLCERVSLRRGHATGRRTHSTTRNWARAWATCRCP